MATSDLDDDLDDELDGSDVGDYDDDDLDDDDPDDEGEEYLTPEGTVAILERAIAEGETFMRGRRILVPTSEITCRGCGCSDSRACPGGCFWVAPNLCSRCFS